MIAVFKFKNQTEDPPYSYLKVLSWMYIGFIKWYSASIEVIP